MILCVLLALFHEGFEGAFPPPQWDTTRTSAVYWQKSSSGTPFQGSYYARVKITDATNSGEIILMTDTIDISDDEPETLRYWYRFSYSDSSFGDSDTIYVEISVDSGKTWNELTFYKLGDETNTWTGEKFDLTSYNGGNVILRFRFVDKAGASATTSRYFWLDSVWIYSRLPNRPPEITIIKYLPKIPDSSDNVTVIAKIKDDYDAVILKDTLFYSIDRGTTWKWVYHDSIRDSIYYYTIPKHPRDTLVYFFIRAWDDSGAAGVSDTLFYLVRKYPEIVINEIMYNPSSELGLDADFEWVELYNYGEDTLDLSKWEFTDGSDSYLIPVGIKLAPKSFVILARNPDTLYKTAEYMDDIGDGNDTVLGPTGVSLGNAGDNVIIKDSFGIMIDSVSYGDAAPWPSEPDGGGPSLELKSPYLDNLKPENWQASYEKWGTLGDTNSKNLVPVIDSVWREPQNPSSIDTTIIFAIIKDDWDTLLKDTLFYRINSNAWIKTLSDSVKDTLYFYHILPQNAGDTVSYFVITRDSEGKKALSDTFSFIVRKSNQPPQFVWVKRTPQYPDTTDTVIIIANIKDDYDTIIDSTLLYYKINAGSWQITHEDSMKDSLHFYHILPQSILSVVKYFIKAVDDSGAFSVSDTYTYVVIAPVPQIVINEIMYNPSDEQGSDDYFEWIELYNATIETVNLKNWEISDGEASYILPDVELAPGHYLVIARYQDTLYKDSTYFDDLGNGDDTVIGPWGSIALSDEDEVILRDSLGRLVDSVHYSYSSPWPSSPRGGGPSLELKSPYLDNLKPENWQASYEKWGTPGEQNSTAPPLPTLVINEIMYNPSTEQGTDLQFEWIEIYNMTAETVNLLNYRIYVPGSGSFTFPDIAFPPFYYLVVARDTMALKNCAEYQDNLGTGDDILTGNFTFSLSNAGATVILYDNYDRVIDSVSYGVLLPWPVEPNGFGPSLELKYPFLDNTKPENWQASYEKWGTPGDTNSTPPPNLPPVIDTVWREPQEPLATDTVIIFAIIKDDYDSIIDNDSLRYKINSGEWVSVYHDSMRDSLHFYHIPPVSDGDTVYYYIWAQDDSGAFSISLPQFYITPGPPPLIVINEIMYNPSQSQGSDVYFEWIELWNYTQDTVDITNWKITDFEDEYIFPTLKMPPGHFVVIARSPDSILKCVEYQDNLLDGNDTVIGPSGIALADSDEIYLYDRWGRVVDSVIYSSGGLWPSSPAGKGPSLELKSPMLDNAEPGSWRASLETYGTPGDTNSVYALFERKILGFKFDILPNPAKDMIFLVYSLPYPSTIKVSIYDAIGRCVNKFTIYRKSGKHKEILDFNLQNGVYFVKVEVNNKEVVKKLIIIR